MPLVWYSNNKQAVEEVAATRPGKTTSLAWIDYINNQQAVKNIAAEYPARTGSQIAPVVRVPETGEYSSFAGADIQASIIIPNVSDPVTFGEIRTIAYSTKRDANPAKILGIINPIGWAMGGRIIAGTLVFTSFDRYVWHKLYNPEWNGKSRITPGAMLPADMLPPFDITITGLNEYGQATRMAIRGVRVIDEGCVIGVDDMYIEQTHTYVAQDIIPWIPQDVSLNG